MVAMDVQCLRQLWIGQTDETSLRIEVKVLVDVDMEVNPEPVQYGDMGSDVEEVKCTNV
jgi:hypothetical protein